MRKERKRRGANEKKKQGLKEKDTKYERKDKKTKE
jgi:hypothetical protein